MKSKIVALAAAALLGTASSASAIVIGDKDWKPLTETTGLTWLIINTVCGTGVCTSDVGGLDIEGWHWADLTDVQELFEELIQPGTTQFPTATSDYIVANDPDIQHVLDAVFLPTATAFGFREVKGLTRTLADPFNAYQPYFNDAPFAASLDFAVLNTTVPTNFGHSSVGLWLYRPVPEPGTLALLGMALAGYGAFRRRQSA